MSRLAGKIAAAAGPVVILAAASLAVVSSSHSPPPPAPAASPTSEAAAPSRYWGASVPSPIPAGLRVLAAKVGVKPGIGAYYQRFGSPFRDGPAAAIAKDGAIPLVQWDPVGVKLSRVAAGRRDGYLKSYAAEVRRFRGRVIISFGHEMNGPWWKWGKGHQPAAEFVAAWRHIHDVFKRAGTSNVIWLWNPNVLSGPPVAHFAAWWPGSSYVDWAGLDGYYWRSHYTFASIFARSLAELRGLAPGKPVIIAETGVYPGPKMAARITDLFSGAAASGVIAVVYFDHDGHADWRIRTTAATEALRKAAARFVNGTATTPAPAQPVSQTPAPPPPAPTRTPPPPQTPTRTPPPVSQTPAQAACYPLTSGGNCYRPGEFCRAADHGMSGVAGDGEAIKCEDNNGWRWEPG